MKCVKCNGELKTEWFKTSYLIHCHHCDSIFNINNRNTVLKVSEPLSSFHNSNMDNVSTTVIPEFKVGEIVTCVDSRNKYFLEYGEVIKLDHMHIRIKFNTKIGKSILWMPECIVSKVPEEWL